MLAARWTLRLGVSISFPPSFSLLHTVYIHEQVSSKFSLSSSSNVSPCLVICDLAISRRAMPFRSRRSVVRDKRKREREGKGALSAINVYFRQDTSPRPYNRVGRTRGTTRQRIMNSTVCPDEGMPDAVKSETDHVDSGINVIEHPEITEKPVVSNWDGMFISKCIIVKNA